MSAKIFVLSEKKNLTYFMIGKVEFPDDVLVLNQSFSKGVFFSYKECRTEASTAKEYVLKYYQVFVIFQIK